MRGCLGRVLIGLWLAAGGLCPTSRTAHAAGPGGAAPALFEAGTGPAPAMGRSGATVLRWAPPVAVARWKAGDRWNLPSWEEAWVGPRVFRVDGVRWLDDGGWTVTGSLEGEPGSTVLLAARKGCVAISVRDRAGRAWAIQPGPAGGHRVVARAGDTVGGECGNGAIGEAVDAAARAGRDRLAALAAGPAGNGGGSLQVLDLAFVYTAAAEAGAGGEAGMQALLDLAVLESNDAYARSGALLELRAVAHRRVTYVESGDLITDLSRLTRDNDGWLDEVHDLRDEVAADLVCLVVESESGNRLAGMANQLTSTTPEQVARGFTACVRPYMIGNYTLAHEVGHLLGCDHDRENSGGSGLHSWSYGTRITVDGVVHRTVMAYRPGVQFPHFSNPRISYRGVATGVADGRTPADNVRTLNATAGLMARVRVPASRIGFGASTVVFPESAGAVTVVLRREGGTEEASVQIEALAGSAVETVDYEAPPRRIDLPAGAGEVPISLTLLDNARRDGPRRFALRLLAPAPASGVSVGPVTTMTVVVTDDEEEDAAFLDTGFRPSPGTDHLVAALVAEETGHLLAGGAFATANGQPRARLARFAPDGTVDAAFVPDVKYQVHALGRWPDGRVAIGGEFNTVQGVRLNHVAVLRTDGSPDPGFEFDAGTDYPVNALVPMSDGRLWIGGAFSSVQGRPWPRVARLTAAGQPDPTFLAGGTPDGVVHALAVDGQGRLLVGGAFRRAGGRDRPGVDRWSGNGVPDAGFAATGDADGAVRGLLAEPSGAVVAVGAFRRFLGRPSGGVVRLTPEGGMDEAFLAATGTGADGPVLAVAPAGDGAIWVAGGFNRFAGVERRRVARLRPDGALDPAFDPGVGPNDTVLALAPVEGGGVGIGGVFTEVNGVARGGVAVLLGAAPAPSRFGTVTAKPGGGIAWEATGAVGQRYAAERSGNLAGWETVEVLDAVGGRMEGSLGVGPSDGPGFLRLRRRLE